ncbi:SNF2 family DNA or RNA helicase [Scopulibacillus darangshiensis]|uniref:SNF2 family DNA or RNA helicase n=1 Tax=Scopulibacillus darangshiensis TaxID=442528 RepID=A0A4R2NPZ6_9BACL|nr:DEAD/DEAH box helicase [Scopulibacillus darangshiensis]TCP23424.1 SNF2 family DNA or RNA helicase [Scopulibacillus darangshiensis]
MNIKLNQKTIKDICGIASFKRGDAFYRAGRVTIDEYGSDRCQATVTGTEDFRVTIEKDARGNIHTACSCPVLASFKKDCQHIAAVLIAINQRQQRSSSHQELTEGFLTLFDHQPKRTSGRQRHFENRQMLEVAFICKPVTIDTGQSMFGIEMRMEQIKVQDIRDFLTHVKKADPCPLSVSFTYDPNRHCFPEETDAVIQQLIQVIQDEKGAASDTSLHTLLIPPSSWDRLLPLLLQAPHAGLMYDRKAFDGFPLLSGKLPLKFVFSETEGKDLWLEIEGLNRITLLTSYRSVLTGDGLIQLAGEESERLSELKQMLDASQSHHIPIPRGQINHFLEKVVPGLKKLGDVEISEAISKSVLKTPLIAKLYLDRVKNRLLAGLEFHYENIVINPLESREPTAGALIIRDVEKEEVILQLMEDSAFTQTDSGYFLHNEELEYAFLHHVVPKLQKQAQIYTTTAVRNRVVKGKARPRIRVKVQKERTNWLEFKFEMDGIPDREIKEILHALEEKRKYYRLRNGSLLSLETREFEEINRFLTALPVQDGDDLESGLNLPVVQGLQLLDAADDVFTLEASFRQFLDNIQNPDSLAFDVPGSLEPVLRDYQKHGYKWMKNLARYGFGGILADDMGLGKTLQSITYILSELSDIQKRNLPVLILCPSSLTYNWLSEITKFASDIQAVIIDGTKTERYKILKDLTGVDVIITSYPLLRSDIKWYEKQSFHTVFFDEAQAFKNPVTQTAKAVKKLKANHCFALTGTPVENALEELWSIFHIIFPELFLGLREFSTLSREKIARRIKPFLLRRKKEDVLSELPGKMASMDSAELLPDQKKLYGAYLAKLRHDTLKHLDKDTLQKNRIKILAGITRLRQICCHPALFVDGYKGSSAKFEQLKKILEESRLSGRRVLIFSQFTKMLELIGRELSNQGRSFFYLDGQTPSEERMERCQRFNAGECDIFLISLKAGGTGLNLTGADTVILYDIWWNPAVEEQAADRAYRIGQTKVVQVIKLVARGTIEDKMNDLQEKKRHLIEEIIDSKDRSPSSLTEEDIREILMI